MQGKGAGPNLAFLCRASASVPASGLLVRKARGMWFVLGKACGSGAALDDDVDAGGVWEGAS